MENEMSKTNFLNLSGDDEKKPKVRRKRKSAESREDLSFIKELIKESLEQHIEITKSRKYKEECAQAVVSILSEFLKTYVVIGYDFEGTPIRIVDVHNGLESDAISTAIHKFVMNMHTDNIDM